MVPTIDHDAGIEAMQVVMKLMEASSMEQRRNIIGRNLDLLRVGIKPVLELLVAKAPEEQLKRQARLNGIMFSSEVSREMALSGRPDDADALAQQDLEWMRQTLLDLIRERDEDLARFIAELGMIHGKEYQRLGMTDSASQAFLLVDPVFEALEIVEQKLTDQEPEEEALTRVMTALLTLKNLGFDEDRKRLEGRIGKLNLTQSQMNNSRQEARKRVSDYWRRLPQPLHLDGLSPGKAFPFRSVMVAHTWVLALPCPRCGEELTSVERPIDRPDSTETFLTFRLSCLGSCQVPAIFYNQLPSAAFLSLTSVTSQTGKGDEGGKTGARQYINYLKSLSPYPLAENDVIEPTCAEALANAGKVLPLVLQGEESKRIHIEVGVVPGLFGVQTSPFVHECRDGFAIIVPEIFAIRLSRFARHLAQTMGVTDGISRTVDPVLEGEQAKELAQMLYREFWEVGLSTRPTEVPERMGGLLIAILENCLTFVVAHELAHIYLGHVGQRRFITLSEQGEEIPLLSYGQKEEILADKMAGRLLQQVVQEQSKNELLETFAMASVDIFFTLLALIERKFPPDPREHPPAFVRRAALRSQVGKGVSGQSLQFAIAAQCYLEAHADEPPKTMDLPQEVRGDWQILELALRSLSLGEKEESLAQLTRFLIREPAEEEGWKLLRHLLLADRPDAVMLSPRGAILVFPEIFQDEIVIRVPESLSDPADGREVERKVWMKYAEELIAAAAKAGGFERLSLQDEEETLSHMLMRCAFVPGLDLSKGSIIYLMEIEEQGFLPVFTYFARFRNFGQPGFSEFCDRLLADSSEARELFQVLIVEAPN